MIATYTERAALRRLLEMVDVAEAMRRRALLHILRWAIRLALLILYCLVRLYVRATENLSR
jgi:hypothetical protein